MKILLDTHVILWSLTDSKKLTKKAREMINDPDNDIYISIISPWEIQIKHDKYPDKMPIDSTAFLDYCSKAGYNKLSVRPSHIAGLSELGQSIHVDPFDRMLICQAKAENMILMTHDKNISNYKKKFILYI